MWLNSFKLGLKKGFLNKDKHFIQRWPSNPKVVIFGPPNSFQDEISQRYPFLLQLSLDLPLTLAFQ
jgi:hypothetical protein